jgi:hypothetical protein
MVACILVVRYVCQFCYVMLIAQSGLGNQHAGVDGCVYLGCLLCMCSFVMLTAQSGLGNEHAGVDSCIWLPVVWFG